MRKPPGPASLLLVAKSNYFAKQFIFCHLLTVVVILQTVLLWGQSGERIVDSQETSTISASSIAPNIRVTETGSVVVTGMPAIDLGDISGGMVIEKGNAASTGLVHSDQKAITSTMTAPLSPSDPNKIRNVKNEGTIKGTTGIDNSGSQAKTIFVFHNWGTLTAGANAYIGGAGVDKVFLHQGSTTIGDIKLGENNNVFNIERGVNLVGTLSADNGNNSLNLAAGSTITRNLTTGNGKNTLQLDSNPLFSPATIEGDMVFTGDIRTSLIKRSGTGNYNASALFVQGDLTLNPTSTISIDSLNGTGTLTTGDKFLILSSGRGVTGNVSMGTPQLSEMLTFETAKENGDKDVYLRVQSRELFANHVNPADKAFAESIDAMIDNHAMTSTNLDSVFGELQLGSKLDAKRFFNDSNPSQFLTVPVSGIRTTQQMTFSIVDRMAVLRERLGRYKTYVPNYYYGQSCEVDDIFEYGGSCNAVCRSRGRDIFVRGFGGYQKEDATSNQLGHRSTFQGMQVGLDRQIDSRSFFGITAGYSDISIKIHQTDNTADDLMLRFGGYYTRLLQNDMFFDAEVTYGHHSNELSRYYTITNVGGRFVHSKYQAHDISTYVGLGRKFLGCNTFYITPLVSAQHIYYRQEAFDERGPYGLYHFNRQGLNSVNLRAALRIGQERWGGKNIGYEFEAGYNLELGDDIRVKGGWIGGPSNMFTMTRPSASDNSFYGAWKLNIRPSDHCQLFGRYLGEGSKGGFAHGAEFGGIWQF